MATKPARIEFRCDKATLQFTHSLPSSLFAFADLDPPSFIAAIEPIFDQHYAACLSHANPTCVICKSPTTQVFLTPMSWLHIWSDPFVHVVSAPACNNPSCEVTIRQEVEETLSAMAAMDPTGPSTSTVGTVQTSKTTETAKTATDAEACLVCRRTQNTFRCARCKEAFYCGKEHQKLDWPLHKLLCGKSVKGS